MTKKDKARAAIGGLLVTVLVLPPQIAMPEVCISFHDKPLQGVVVGITESAEVILEPSDPREGGAPVSVRLVEYEEIDPKILRLLIGGRTISCTKIRNQTESESDSSFAIGGYGSTMQAHCCVAFVGTLGEGESRVESVNRMIEAISRN